MNLLHTEGELYDLVTRNVLQESEVMEQMIKYELSCLKGCGQAWQQYQAQGLRKTVADHHDDHVALGFRKVGEKKIMMMAQGIVEWAEA